MLRADDFQPRAPAARPPGRVHLIEDDDEVPRAVDGNGRPLSAITPFVAADAKGNLITAQGEADMPKGIYPRKPRIAPPQVEKIKPGCAGKRVGLAPRLQSRFGVFDDGTVVINTAACKGSLDASEAKALVDFIARLRGKGA